ncbi:MAG: hypothetical protein GY796_24580 [Chloroflexi bacterium]|nr:hypothetical protein [Chloroflexota bacterium]
MQPARTEAFANKTTGDEMVSRKLELLTTIVVAEQNNYWLRFTAFSALSAGLVVGAISIESASNIGYFGLERFAFDLNR